MHKVSIVQTVAMPLGLLMQILGENKAYRLTVILYCSYTYLANIEFH